jgi:hypothetical protein
MVDDSKNIFWEGFVHVQVRNQEGFVLRKEELSSMECLRELITSGNNEVRFLFYFSDSKIKNKWNEVARKFYEKSNHKHFRTGKQCR